MIREFFHAFRPGIFMFCTASILVDFANAQVVEQELDAGEIVDRTALIDEITEVVQLFDGKTLNGWTGSDGYWTVEDGAITGTSTADNPLSANTFLVYRNELPTDYVLRLEFRIESGNSGIQFRSEEFEPHRLAGYQADIDSGMTYTGILYEERRRGILCRLGESVTIDSEGKRTVERIPAEDSENSLSAENEQSGGEEETVENKFRFPEGFRADEWHTYQISVDGNRIELAIDDQITIRLVDGDEKAAARSGVIGLQLHQGPPMRVQFRNIRLQKLEGKGNEKQGAGR